MSLIVKKFGGSSVADAERVFNVANIIIDDYKKGNNVIVVVSAQGDTTDDLIDKAKEIDPERRSGREMDMLLAAGEQISVALLAMAIEKLGYPAVSLLGWQAGFNTDANHTRARIKRVDTERLSGEIEKNRIVIVAGFQGVDRYGDLTTLGRGGSDTSAVAIAAAMHADICQIYTDVSGVFTTDPRIVPTARKMSEITYDEMLELATLGAQVLNNRSVEMAKKYNVELEVLSSLERASGTIVKEVANMEKMLIRGVAKDDDIIKFCIVGLNDSPGIAFKVLNQLSKRNVNVDLIVQSVGRNNTKDMTFTASRDQLNDAVAAINELHELTPFENFFYDEDVTKVSIVGAGMESHPGVATKMFEALYDSGINIQVIATSEIKISVLIDRKDGKRAVEAIHKKFFD